MTDLSRPAPAEGQAKTVPGEPLIAFKDVRIGFDEGDVLQDISFEVWPGRNQGASWRKRFGQDADYEDGGRAAASRRRAHLGDGTRTERNERSRTCWISGGTSALCFRKARCLIRLPWRKMSLSGCRKKTWRKTKSTGAFGRRLRFVELESTVDQYPAELSGGMRRRVSIARALVDRPPLVFYDSPTAGLDPVTSQTIITLVLRGRDLQGVTSLLATHRVQDAFGLASFRLDAKSGRLIRVDFDGNRGAPEPAGKPAVWNCDQRAGAAGWPRLFRGARRPTFCIRPTST